MIWGRWSSAGLWALCPLTKFGLKLRQGDSLKVIGRGMASLDLCARKTLLTALCTESCKA